ncbi:hypothetical protein JCM11491_005485 [Sporobolomyces phaffii]
MAPLRWDIQRLIEQLNTAFAAVVEKAEVAHNNGNISNLTIRALENWRTEMTDKLGLASGKTLDKHLLESGATEFVLDIARDLTYGNSDRPNFWHRVDRATSSFRPPHVPASIVGQLHARFPLPKGTSNSLAKASNDQSNRFRPVSRNHLVGGITSEPF